MRVDVDEVPGGGSQCWQDVISARWSAPLPEPCVLVLPQPYEPAPPQLSAASLLPSCESVALPQLGDVFLPRLGALAPPEREDSGKRGRQRHRLRSDQGSADQDEGRF